ncbi:unnamed protein product [Enterobius vermicularis]|uniref:Uncharacterized protein n=1 Tax=Enterobius vermicularis TaxID=51028 RepID=A0A0N4VFF1_ENTVE|nr:unnamed protein product [Enterobius vermicularis]
MSIDQSNSVCIGLTLDRPLPYPTAFATFHRGLPRNCIAYYSTDDNINGNEECPNAKTSVMRMDDEAATFNEQQPSSYKVLIDGVCDVIVLV